MTREGPFGSTGSTGLPKFNVRVPNFLQTNLAKTLI